MSNTISACLVIFNEGKVLDKCLSSLKGLADEIIVVHDGECADDSLEIARRYTDKIFVRPHVGMMEAHLVFAYEQANCDWLLRIDADEYFDQEDQGKIKDLLNSDKFNGYIFKWEMWNGRQPVYFRGLEKMCFMRRNKFHYIGIPHATGWVDGQIGRADLFLHHRPKYDNIAWKSFWFKVKSLRWVSIHAGYFFPELVEYQCFNAEPSSWLAEADKVKANYLRSVVWYPLKNFLGQLKNGLWLSRVGISLACQQYVYYFLLYLLVWKMSKKLK